MTFIVTIGGNPYEVYGGATACGIYLGAAIGDPATAWVAASPTLQAQLLVAATRYIDAQVWQGLPTSPAVGGTTLQWPRTGVIDANGIAVDATTVPQNLINGVFELAAILADDPDVFSAADQGTNTKGVKAGSASVDYFVPTSASDGSAPLFPIVVQRLIAQYLGAAVETIGGAVASGTDGRSEFSGHRDTFRRSWPF